MKWLIAIVVVVLVVVGYSVFSFTRKVGVSTELIRNTIPYTLKGSGAVSVLVLGDSTAVGVGARVKEESLAALFADAVHATNVENRAISGARIADIPSEIETATGRAYTYILLGVGANDIVRFKNADTAGEELAQALQKLPDHQHLIVYMAGNVGGTELFPFILNGAYLNLTVKYHGIFKAKVEEAGGTYVDLYEDPDTDPFIRDPERYFAADGFHPSSAGYRLWFEKIVPVLE